MVAFLPISIFDCQAENKPLAVVPRLSPSILPATQGCSSRDLGADGKAIGKRLLKMNLADAEVKVLFQKLSLSTS